jgi:hypothetical protein
MEVSNMSWLVGDEGKGDHESIYPWEWISKYKTAIYKGAGVKTEKPS